MVYLWVKWYYCNWELMLGILEWDFFFLFFNCYVFEFNVEWLFFFCNVNCVEINVNYVYMLGWIVV